MTRVGPLDRPQRPEWWRTEMLGVSDRRVFTGNLHTLSKGVFHKDTDGVKLIHLDLKFPIEEPKPHSENIFR